MQTALGNFGILLYARGEILFKKNDGKQNEIGTTGVSYESIMITLAHSMMMTMMNFILGLADLTYMSLCRVFQPNSTKIRSIECSK